MLYKLLLKLKQSVFLNFISLYKNRVIEDGGTLVNSTTLDNLVSTNESLIMVPSGYKAAKLYSVLPEDGSGDLTVTRNTEATYIDENGSIQISPFDTPRFDFSDNLIEPVLLTEPSSINLFFGSAILLTQNVTVTANEYTVSFYGLGTINFTGVYTGSLVGTGINDLVSLTFTPIAGSLICTVIGDVTNGQIELGDYASSRIITLGTSMLRAAEIISGAGDVNTFNTQEGVIYLKVKLPQTLISKNMTINIGDASNRITLEWMIDGGFRAWVRFNNEGLYVQSIAYDFYSNYSEIAFIWDNLSKIMELYIDGVSLGTKSFTAEPTTNFNDLSFNILESYNFYGKIKELKVYKSILEAEINLPYLI